MGLPLGVTVLHAPVPECPRAKAVGLEMAPSCILNIGPWESSLGGHFLGLFEKKLRVGKSPSAFQGHGSERPTEAATLALGHFWM